MYKATAASEPMSDSAALGGGLALLLEWEMCPGEGLCLPSLEQVFTHFRKKEEQPTGLVLGGPWSKITRK